MVEVAGSNPATLTKRIAYRVAYRVESLLLALPEIRALVPEQFAEMAHHAPPEYEVGWELYARAEHKGRGFLITAREPALVGYFGMLVQPHTQGGFLAATSTPYYVVPRPARGLILRSLIREAVREARNRGARTVAIKTHPWADCGPILKREGFQPVETWHMLHSS